MNKFDAILDGVIELMLHSKLHANYPIAVLKANIVNSLAGNGNRIYTEEGRVVGFINWTFLSFDEVEALGRRKGVMSPELWRSQQPNMFLFIPEIIAPFGHFRQICKDLEGIFPEIDAAYAFSWKRCDGEAGLAGTPRLRCIRRSSEF